MKTGVNYREMVQEGVREEITVVCALGRQPGRHGPSPILLNHMQGV